MLSILFGCNVFLYNHITERKEEAFLSGTPNCKNGHRVGLQDSISLFNLIEWIGDDVNTKAGEVCSKLLISKWQDLIVSLASVHKFSEGFLTFDD